jgi:hypothetical protein
VLVASVITSSSGLDGHNQNTGSTQVTQLGIVDTIVIFSSIGYISSAEAQTYL